MDLVGGAVDSRGGYVSKILYVKTKELGPLGGGARAGRAPLDPPMLMFSIGSIIQHLRSSKHATLLRFTNLEFVYPCLLSLD